MGGLNKKMRLTFGLCVGTADRMSTPLRLLLKGCDPARNLPKQSRRNPLSGRAGYRFSDGVLHDPPGGGGLLW